MKNKFTKILSLALVLVMCLGALTACPPPAETGLSTEVYEGDVIYVGNTAGTTGALADIGVPFNLGIRAAFAEYNANGGFNGKTVELKHHDDEGTATNSVSLMEKLIHEDEVFAIVGNYGGYALNVNLDILKENCVPMVYAAAGVEALYNTNATTDGDRCIFPVQPLNNIEGRALIVRAFANAFTTDNTITGGLQATKVGVISNQDEASQGILRGIKLEAESLPASKKNNIVYQDVPGTDFSAAATAIVSEGCDTVIVTVTGKSSFIAALTALAQANFRGNVLTSYNNSDATALNSGVTLSEVGKDILSKMTIYAHGWLDVTSATYIYNSNTPLFRAYKVQDKELYGEGVQGFSESYWKVAEAIFNYAMTVDKSTAWPMSYNSYALAGYIAGNLFCNALEALEESGKELTRANFVEIMETVDLQVAMAGTISYANGVRTGRETFSLAVFYDTANPALGENATSEHIAASAPYYAGLQSIEELRQYITE